MNKSGDLGSLSGQLTSIPKKTGEELIKKTPVEGIETIIEQAGVEPVASKNPLEDRNNAGSSSGADTLSKEATREYVKESYKKSGSAIGIPSDKTINAVIEENPEKTPEEIQKLSSTRQQLLRQQLLQQRHDEVYANAIKNPSLVKRKEPRPAEEIEKEEKEKKQKQMEELQMQEKKKEEVASPFIKQGTVERIRG